MGKKLYDNILLSMTTLYYVLSFISDSLPGGQFLTIAPLFVMLLLYLKKNSFKLKLYAGLYFLYLIAFLAFCMLSRLWAQNSQLAVPKINSLLIILAAMIVIVACIYSKRDVDFLLKTIMYGGHIICIYVFFRYGWSGVIHLLNSNSRLSNEILNANTLGICASYSLVINIYYILYDKAKPRDFLMLPAAIIIIITGSRKAIGVVLLGTLGIFILKNINNKNALLTLLKVVGILLTAALLLFILSKLPVFENITNRFRNLISLLQGNESRGTSSAWIRLAYTRLGMDLYREHPWLGIGIANANIYTNQYYGHNHYLHNNYVELLACGGTVGFLLYYSIWIYLICLFLKYRKLINREYIICFVLLFIHMIMDYGAVMYYGKATYVFLLLFWMEGDKLKRQSKKN
ncbi:MAG: O-antigen ligase family protein [Clostridia bacterium]|nr:O-antigen ligase family protein [Clostridia bacterium]